MGNNVSVAPIIPLSFGDCFIDGKFDIYKYQIYILIKKKREREDISFYYYHTISNKDLKPPPTKRIRTVKKHELIIAHPNSSTAYMEPTNYLWYNLYVQSQPSSKKAKKYVCKYFSLSHRQSKHLLTDVKQKDIFKVE